MNEDQTREVKEKLLPMRDRKIPEYNDTRYTKVICETPKVIELGDVADRHSYNPTIYNMGPAGLEPATAGL